MIYAQRPIDGNREIKDQILRACHSFLVPVARFLLRSGVSYREFADVCRAAFVQVARDEFGIRGRPTNSSRIAAMTGISRKEIARIRETLRSSATDTRTKLSPLSDVLQLWHSSRKYTNAEGAPLPLPFEGGDVSFSELVKECVGDLPAGAIRVELIRYGAVSCDEAGLIRALRREVVPDSFDMKLISAVSFSLTRLAETVAFNSDSTRKGPGRIERLVQSDDISQEAREELRPIVRRRTEEFSREIDDLFAQYAQHTNTNVIEKNRIGIGLYYFEDSGPV